MDVLSCLIEIIKIELNVTFIPMDASFKDKIKVLSFFLFNCGMRGSTGNLLQ